MSTTDPDENGPTNAAPAAGSRVLKYLTGLVAVLGGAWVVSLVWVVLLAKAETATPTAAKPVRSDYSLYVPDNAQLVARFDIAKARRSPLYARLAPVDLGSTAEIFAVLSEGGEWALTFRTTDDKGLAEVLAKYDAEGPRTREGFQTAAVKLGRDRLYVAKTAASTYLLATDEAGFDAALRRVAKKQPPTLPPRFKGVLDCLSVYDHYVATAGPKGKGDGARWQMRRMFGELRHLSYGAAGLGASAGRELTMGAVVSFGNRIEAEWFGREMSKRLDEGIPRPEAERDRWRDPWNRRDHRHLALLRRLLNPALHRAVVKHNGPFTTLSLRVGEQTARDVILVLELATGEPWAQALRRSLF